MSKKKVVNLERGSIFILFAMAFVTLLISALDKFNVINLTSQSSSIITIMGAGFIIWEQLQKHKGKLFQNIGNITLMSLMGLAVLGSVLTLIGINLGMLQPVMGFLLIAIIIVGTFELFF